MLQMYDGSVFQNGCLNDCVQLCGSFAGNFVLVQVELNRTNFHRDSNQVPLGNSEERRPQDSGSGEKSIFELEFSPVNKREFNCHFYKISVVEVLFHFMFVEL